MGKTTKITFNGKGQQVKKDVNDMGHALSLTIDEYCGYEGCERKSGLRDAITTILHLGKNAGIKHEDLIEGAVEVFLTECEEEIFGK